MTNKKILLFIGPIPLPKGGVSVHIQRLSTLMSDFFQIIYIDESRKKKEEYFNLRSINIVKYLSLLAKTDIVHIHSGPKTLRIFHIICAKLLHKNIVVTLHNSRQFKNNIYFKIEKEILKCMVDKLILVNADLVKIFNIDKCILQHAFIPPLFNFDEKLPKNLIEIVNQGKDLNKTIIVANAWQLENYNNKDLYGLDLCVKLIEMLRKDDKKVLLIFNVSTLEKYSEKFIYYLNIIKEKELESDFKLLNLDISFVKLIELSDLVLRPTLTDGDALTIRETIYLNKPVIASDVVERPKGTITFKTGNIKDLYEKTLSMLGKNSNYMEQDNNSIHYYKNLYYNIYNEAINTKY